MSDTEWDPKVRAFNEGAAAAEAYCYWGKQADYERAVERLTFSLSGDARDWEAHYSLACLYIAAGKRTDAGRHIDQVAKCADGLTTEQKAPGIAYDALAPRLRAALERRATP